jgi:hypothetical protein
VESAIDLYGTELIGSGSTGRNWTVLREVEQRTAE